MNRPAGQMRRCRARARFALPAVVAVLSLAVLATPAAADLPGSTAEALSWVDSELDANGGYLPAPSSADADWGLTADAALAHISTGRATSDRSRAIADVLLDALGEYSTWDNIGPEYAGVRLAGPLAKVLLVARSAGLDTSDVDRVDLEAELAGLLQTSGMWAGRYSDRNPHGRDVSNGFGQAYAVLATSLLGDVPPRAVSFLAAQQCPSGGFRLVYEETTGCAADDEADPDATALAVQALLVLERTDEVASALARATGWLLAAQGDDGSFAAAPPADVPNANTTGLVAQALRAAGQTAAADRAAAWVASALQIGASADATPAAPDRGAIAYRPSVRDEALSSGLANRDQWRRSTPQGLLAFDAGLIVQAVDEPPVEPVAPPPTPTTTTTPTTTVVAAPQPPQASEPPAGSGPGAGVAGVQASAAANGPTQGGGAELAATGSTSGALAVSGLALVAAGVLAVWLAVRMRPLREAWTWQP